MSCPRLARARAARAAAFMGGAREYYDLDAPENQRSVLDYGDL